MAAHGPSNGEKSSSSRDKATNGNAASSDSALIPIVMIFGGCMLSIIAMEYVLKGDSQAGNLLSLTEICFVLLQSLPGRIQNFRPKPFVAPWVSHLQFTLLWSSMSIVANLAFAYKISVTIFTMVRSSNLIATVFLGRLVFGCRYSWLQLLCVCSVSVGIFLASMGEAKTISSPSAGCDGCSDAQPVNGALDDDGSFLVWMTGISMLAFAQFVQGLLGHMQAGFYNKYKDLAPKSELSDEYLFASQIVALAPLVLLREDIMKAAGLALQSEQMPFLPIPSRIAWLAVNCLANMICLKGVFRTSSIVSPLTLTIILSVRKFLSVLVSILWFRNPWTVWHSVAIFLIFGGAFAYSQAPELPAVEASGEDAAKKRD